MLKILTICFSFLVVVDSLPFATSDDVIALAKWAAPQMAQFTQINGKYTVLTVRNLQLNNNNYHFTVDLLIQDLNYNYLVIMKFKIK